MEVDPKNEKEMLSNFQNIFLPEAKKHPGFISVKMLKFQKGMLGTAPPVNYRFELDTKARNYGRSGSRRLNTSGSGRL